MVTGTATIPRNLVYTARTVKGFLDYLLPTARHWNSAKHGDLAFRGQASSVWPLLPSAFRSGKLASYGVQTPTQSSPSRVIPQVRAEFRAVHEFVMAADDSALEITNGGRMLLSRQGPQAIFENPDWEQSWPRAEIWDTVALAQHHGVPTRLLDFTQDPLVGAYFAASTAWDPKNRQRVAGSDRQHLAVWVIDLRFIRAINDIRRRIPERIMEIRVPRSNNAYLNAQSGFFLIDQGANDVMNQRGSLAIDQIILERAEFWHSGNRLSGNNIRHIWFGDAPIKQVRLRTTLTSELLNELASRGVSRSTLMPSLDRVVESLKFRRSTTDADRV